MKIRIHGTLASSRVNGPGDRAVEHVHRRALRREVDGLGAAQLDPGAAHGASLSRAPDPSGNP